MNVRTAPRTAIDYWLRAARLPFDAATHVLPAGNGRGPPPVSWSIARMIRSAVGGVLHDDEIVTNAAGRRAAAEERQRARAPAERRGASDRGRRAAVGRAGCRDAASRRGRTGGAQRKAAVDDERARREARVREETDAQERAVSAAHQETRATETKAAKRARLALLEEQAKTLDQDADALTAQDEAQRLRDAAASAKAARKRAH